MRLIHTKTLELDEFFGESIPLYAILSHTWEKDEVSFQEMKGDQVGLDGKAGYIKIQQSCLVAAEDGFEYIWIDTCCIDKTSSSELSEAINSMYRWYRDCDVCYAYLTDVYMVPKMENDLVNFTSTDIAQFRSIRWFTRGWTLQELIAPLNLIFYSAKWEVLGTKHTLKNVISSITGIHLELFSGDPLESFSVAQRMSWASERQTTREEDIAYSLMGIFGVHMPMLYGEGASAFQRLQEEIIRKTDDQTVFAWGFGSNRASSGPALSASPSAFRLSRTIVRSPNAGTGPFSMTNTGLKLDIPLVNRQYLQNFDSYSDNHKESLHQTLIILNCADSNEPGSVVGIPVSLYDTRTQTYLRYACCELFKGIAIGVKLEAHERSIFLKVPNWVSDSLHHRSLRGCSLLLKPENPIADGIIITQTFPPSQLQRGCLVIHNKRDWWTCALQVVKDNHKYFVIIFRLLCGSSLEVSVKLSSGADDLKEAAGEVDIFGRLTIDPGWKYSDASDFRWQYPGESWGVKVTGRRTLIDGKRCWSVAISAVT